MLEAFPCVPIMSNAPLGVAVLSYNGQLDFGLTGDWDILPDLDVFAAGLEESRRELWDAAGPTEVPARAGADAGMNGGGPG